MKLRPAATGFCTTSIANFGWRVSGCQTQLVKSWGMKHTSVTGNESTTALPLMKLDAYGDTTALPTACKYCMNCACLLLRRQSVKMSRRVVVESINTGAAPVAVHYWGIVMPGGQCLVVSGRKKFFAKLVHNINNKLPPMFRFVPNFSAMFCQNYGVIRA